jgi:endonuclease IV
MPEMDGLRFLEAFRKILSHKVFRGLPMVLETPKDGEDEFEMDIRNLATLRGLAGSGR